MKKKIFQTILLVLLVTLLLTALALCYRKNILFVQHSTNYNHNSNVDEIIAEYILNSGIENIFFACCIASCFLVLFVNRILKYMSEVMYIHSPLSKIDKMTGEEFEYYLKLKLERLHYKVEITPASNDYGADLFCFRGDDTLVIQAKRYAGNVGTAAVQEVTAAKDYYEACGAVVITNSHFTINALNLAEANKVALIDRDALLHFREENLHYVDC